MSPTRKFRDYLIEKLENPAEAATYLSVALEEYEAYVDKAVKVKLEQNQYDALVSWTYNLGPAKLNEHTKTIRTTGHQRRYLFQCSNLQLFSFYE